MSEENNNGGNGNGKKIGRPPKEIDYRIFEELCKIQCTHEEISNILDISRSQLYEHVKKHYEEDFPTVYKKFTDVGKASLRRLQFRLAERNAGMAIFLGKQYLGQKDKIEVDPGELFSGDIEFVEPKENPNRIKQFLQ